MKKQLAVLMSAAVLASGGLALAGQSAYAMTNTYGLTQAGVQEAGAVADTSAVKDAVTYERLVALAWLHNLPQTVSNVYGLDYGSVMQDIGSGKTLSDFAGASYVDMIPLLTDRFTQDIANDTAFGVLTQAEADQAAAELKAALPDLLTQPWSNGTGLLFADHAGKAAVAYRVNRVIDDTALLTGLNASDLRADLKAGQTLSEATAWDAATLTSSLVQGLSDDLAKLLAKGLLTADEADKLKADGEKSLGGIVTTPGYDIPENDGMKQIGKSIVSEYMKDVVRYAAVYANVDYSIVVEALNQGSNLVEATGLTADSLQTYLEPRLDSNIELAWLNGTLSAKTADQVKADASQALKDKIVAKGTVEEAKSNSSLAKESLRSLVNWTASYAGQYAGDLRKSLDGGASLVSATGLPESELTGVLTYYTGAYLDTAAANGLLQADELAATKAEAVSLVQAAVNEAGFAAKVDADAYLQERLDRIVSDAASISGTAQADILASLASGYTFTQAAKSDSEDLYHGLLKAVNKDVNELVASGSLTSDDAVKIKTHYAVEVAKRF